MEASTGTEHFELTDIEVPGREAALEAQGETVPAASAGASESGGTNQPEASAPAPASPPAAPCSC